MPSLPTDQVYFKGALGALIVYDISRPQTFDSAAKVGDNDVTYIVRIRCWTHRLQLSQLGTNANKGRNKSRAKKLPPSTPALDGVL